MSTNTTNYGLTKPAYSDTADIADINGNMDTVDSEMTKLSKSVAVVEFGDTATQAISNGAYVVWKGNLYKANQAISSGATLSGKLTAVSGGGLNDVYSSLNGKIGNLLKYKFFKLTTSNGYCNFGVTGGLKVLSIQPAYTAASMFLSPYFYFVSTGDETDNLQQSAGFYVRDYNGNKPADNTMICVRVFYID